MYIIRDALGQVRAATSLYPFETVEEAIDGGHDVDMNPEIFPQEYPFSVVNKDTGEVVHQWHMPTLHDWTFI
jgi:hypothetical protein